MNLGKNIRNRREQLGLSQIDLAKMLGYKDRSTIAKIESGVNDITQSKVFAIANALETTPAALMGLDSNPQPIESDELGATKKALYDLIDTLSEEQARRLLQIGQVAFDK